MTDYAIANDVDPNVPNSFPLSGVVVGVDTSGLLEPKAVQIDTDLVLVSPTGTYTQAALDVLFKSLVLAAGLHHDGAGGSLQIASRHVATGLPEAELTPLAAAGGFSLTGLYFDGTVPSSGGVTDLNIASNDNARVTINAWFKPDADALADPISTRDIIASSMTESAISLFTFGGTPSLYVCLGNSVADVSACWQAIPLAGVVTMGAWNHLVVSVNLQQAADSDARGLLYINGVKITASRNDPDAGQDANVYLETIWGAGQPNAFKGCLDQILVIVGTGQYDLDNPAVLATFYDGGAVDVIANYPTPNTYLAGNNATDFFFSPYDATWLIPSDHTDACAAYHAKAVHFDGSTVVENSGTPTRIDALTGLASFWIKPSSNWNGQASGSQASMVLSTGNGPDVLNLTPIGVFTGLNSHCVRFATTLTAGNQVIGDTPVDSVPQSKWAHVLLTWDTNHDKGSRVVVVYINDVLVSVPLTEELANFGPFGVPLMDPCFLGKYVAASGLEYEGDLADMWLETDILPDLGDSAVRRKFISASGKPVDLGADGSTPFGSSPKLCFNKEASVYANAGTFDAFTVTAGALTNASSSPSV